MKKQPIVASELRIGGSKERIIASNGEINASSKQDAFAQQQKLLMAAAGGAVITEADAKSRAEETAFHRELVLAAFNDERAHKELGEAMGTHLYQAMNRRGFMRKYLFRQDVQDGNPPRIFLRKQDVTSVWATSASTLMTQVVRDSVFYPPEMQVESRPFITQNDLNQSPADLLEEKYNEALQSIMVGEDRLWYMLANATINVANDLTLVSGTLTPLVLAQVRNKVASWGLKATGCLMASDLFTDIIGDSTFIQAIEPVARHELIMTGELATLYGMTITTDAYRHPEHKVLSAGEFFVISDPQTHGAYTDRNGIDTQPTDGVSERKAGRGWWMYESLSAMIGNARSVAKGIRT